MFLLTPRWRTHVSIVERGSNSATFAEPRYSALAFAPQSLNVYAIERWLKPRVLCNLYTIYPKEKIIPPYHHTCTRRIFISSTTSAADF